MIEFPSIGAFLEFLGPAPEAIVAAAQEALAEGAALVQREAKESLGDAGLFEPLAESTQAVRERQGYPPDEPLLREGVLREHIGREVAPGEAEVGVPSAIVTHPYDARPRDIGMLAEVHEFGNETTPPRPFLSRALIVHEEAIVEAIGAAAAYALAGQERPA